VIEHWRALGFAVPRVVNWWPPNVSAEASLALEWIQWPTLQSVLRDAERHEGQRAAAVDKVFAEMARRHQIALDRDDSWLAHLDANTGNVLINDERVCRLDFESASHDGPVAGLLAKEVVKLCRWIARDWHPDRLLQIVECLWKHYASLRGVLETAVQGTYRHSSPFWRRLRNAQKKRRSVGEVTKYDVVDAIAATGAIRPQHVKEANPWPATSLAYN
jgi:hypothetical protein